MPPRPDAPAVGHDLFPMTDLARTYTRVSAGAMTAQATATSACEMVLGP